jgi:hypothetical protein
MKKAPRSGHWSEEKAQGQTGNNKQEREHTERKVENRPGRIEEREKEKEKKRRKRQVLKTQESVNGFFFNQ